MNIVFLFNSIALGVGLAMDAFSVSLANGLHECRMSKKKLVLIAFTFAFFQALMPMTGWLCVHTILNYFTVLEKAIPYIALALLGYIGISMILEKEDEEDDEHPSCSILSFKKLIIQGVATSIDALSVGFTIAEYDLMHASLCASIIAAVTFIICVAGLIIGKKAGAKLGRRANIFGGVILILIGLEIFITSFF
ncbi:MAG: manganese efflux pump MntP family protein [Bullifex sp.]